jgi:hypothetical protein
MAITRVWQGGGNNRTSDPYHWSPAQVPQPGDFVQVLGRTTANSFTMNVQSGDLAGDSVSIYNANLTANLSHHAHMTARMLVSNTGTFNLSQNSSLDLSLTSGFQVGINTASINISGNDRLLLADTDSRVDVNLMSSARWNGTFTMGSFFGVTFGRLTVQGGPGSAFNNNGHSSLLNSEQATINADVIGTGSFAVRNQSSGPIARLEFAASVGPNQSIENSGVVQIDHPDRFAAHVTLMSDPAPGSASPAEIDLMGLATADSYSYRNDMLSIFSGNSVIDRLRLHDSTPHGFVVEKTTGSVNIVAITDPAHPPAGLPLHIGV